MTDIATLVLAVDSRQVDQGGKSLDRLTDAGGRAETAAGKLTSATAVLGNALRVGAAAVGVTATGILAAAKAAIDAADAMNDLHLKTGLAFKDLAAFDLLARQSGTTIDGVAESVKFLQRYMVEHGDSLRALGVDSKDAGVALGQFADVIAGIEDPALRSALAMEVLGRGGATMLPMLVGGSAAFREASAASEEYGRILGIVAPMADGLNDNLETLATRVKTAALTMVSTILPTLSDMVGAMSAASGQTDILSAALVGLGRGGTILQTMAVLVNNLGFVFRVLANDAVSSLTAMGYAMTLQFGQAKKTMEQAAAYAAKQRAELDRLDAQILGLTTTQKASSAAAVAGDSVASKAAAARTKALEDLVRKMLAGTKATKEHKTSAEDMTAAEWAMEESAHAARTALELQAEATEYAVVAEERQAAAVDALNERYNAWEASQDAAKQSLEQQVRSIEESTFALTANADQMREHNVQLALERSGLDRASDAWTDYEARLRAAYAAQAQAQDQKKATDELVDMWKSAEDAAHQMFSGIMSGGKDAFQRLKDSAQSLFFDWLYSMTVKKWVVNIAASMSGSAAAGQAGAGGIGGVGSWVSSIAGMGGTFATGFMNSIGGGAGFMGNMANGLTAGAGMWSAGQYGNSLAMYAGTLAPLITGIGLITSLVSAFSTGGTPHQGTSMQFGLGGSTSTLGRSDLGGQLPNWLADMGDSSPFADAVRQLGVSMVQQLNSDMSTLGGTLGADFALQFGFAAEREAETASGGFARVMLGGETVLEIYDRYAKDGKKGIEQFAADVLPRVRLAGIQMAEGLSPAIDALADSLDPATASVQAINDLLVEIGNASSALNIAESFGQLGISLGTTDEQIIATGNTLAGFAGGFGALQQGLAGYVSAIYTEAEQLDMLAGSLSDAFADLGYEMPTTREDFRALMASIDVTTEAGAKATAALITMAPALGRVIDAADAKALNEAAKAADLAASRRRLEIDLMEAIGDASGALAAQRELELAAMDESMQGLQRQVWAAQDAATLESSRRELEIALMRATGDEAGALAAERERELAAMDPSLRALQQQVWAAEDVATAANSAAKQTSSFASRISGFVSMLDSQYSAFEGIAGILGGGDLGKSLATEIQFVQSQISATERKLQDPRIYGRYGGVTQEVMDLTDQLHRMQAQMAELTGQYNLYLREEAAHPGFGSQLVELANWYEEQQAALAGNLEGQALLELAYQQRRNEILASGTQSGLDALRDQLGDWLDKVSGGELSPLTDQAKLQLAQQQFMEQYKAAAMGDETALGSITQYAEALLSAQKDVTGFGGAYSAVYSDTLAKVKGLATAPNGPIPVPGLQPANSTDIRTMSTAVTDRLVSLEQTVGRLLERIASETTKSRTEVVAAVTTGTTTTARAITYTNDIKALA